MQLVAASRMKGFQRKALGARAYARSLLGLLAKNGEALRETSYGEQRQTGKVLFVLITSDKGLCGALNARLIRELFSSSVWNDLNHDERLLITVGRKSREAAGRFKAPILKSFEGVKEDLDTLGALEIVNEILGSWERGECKEIRLVAPEYVNPFVFNVKMKTYLPLTKNILQSHGLPMDESLGDGGLIHEPSLERVAEALALQIVQSLFTEAFFELKASEYSSRMVAMKSATDAATDLGKTLTIEYNKARQSKITQELAEISGAVAALET